MQPVTRLTLIWIVGVVLALLVIPGCACTQDRCYWRVGVPV
jgi:hypothetical protein